MYTSRIFFQKKCDFPDDLFGTAGINRKCFKD